jgi:predicted O-methyltransferase YrrM
MRIGSGDGSGASFQLKKIAMMQEINQPFPKNYNEINVATKSCGFTMASDVHTCCFLRTLAASKPGGQFLELGTGTGLATSWILDGMDEEGSLISIDNDPALLGVAETFLGNDRRLELIAIDGQEWVNRNKGKRFDYIFADTWHGKFLLLEEVLTMLNKGGLYIIDDMLPQPNWPDGHHEKVSKLLGYLENRDDLILTRQVWATGIVVAVKK